MIAEQLRRLGSDRSLTTLKGALIAPYAPADAGDFVGERDGGDVVPSTLVDPERPGAEIIRRRRATRGEQSGACSMDEHRTLGSCPRVW